MKKYIYKQNARCEYFDSYNDFIEVINITAFEKNYDIEIRQFEAIDDDGNEREPWGAMVTIIALSEDAEKELKKVYNLFESESNYDLCLDVDCAPNNRPFLSISNFVGADTTQKMVDLVFYAMAHLDKL